MYWVYTLLYFILTSETWIIRKEVLKSVSSSRDKQATPDAIAKTDWNERAICQRNKVESCPADFQALVWCWISPQDPGWEYSEVQGPRLHAYTERPCIARWRWWIREYDRNVQSTLAQRLLWSLQFYKVEKGREKTSAWKWTAGCMVELVHVLLRLHLSTTGVHVFFCGEYFTRDNPLQCFNNWFRCACQAVWVKLIAGDLDGSAGG